MIGIGTLVNNSGANVGSLVSPSVAGGTDIGYILGVYLSGGETVSTVTGGGLTWTQQVVQPGGRSQTAVELWTAFGSPTSFTVTATFVGSASAAIIIVMPLTGLDVSVPFEDGVGANTNGEGGAGAGGADDDNVEVTTGSTRFESMHVAVLNPRDTTIGTPDSDYTNQATVGPVGSGGNAINGIMETFIKTATGDDLYDPTLTADVDWSVAGIVARRAFITTPTDINKGGEYRVNFEDQEVIKTGEYRALLADIDIQRIGEYRTKVPVDINLGGAYALLIGPATDINLGAVYRMLLEQNIVVPGTYRARLADIDKNLAGVFRINNITDISIPGVYRVPFETDINLLGGYSVGNVMDLNFLGVYKILMADQDLTKPGDYRMLLADNDLNLAGKYLIIAPNDIQLTGDYRVVLIQDLIKAGQYHLLPTFEQVFGGEYRTRLGDNDIIFDGDFNVVIDQVDVSMFGQYFLVGQPSIELLIELPLTEDDLTNATPIVDIELSLEES